MAKYTNKALIERSLLINNRINDYNEVNGTLGCLHCRQFNSCCLYSLESVKNYRTFPSINKRTMTTAIIFVCMQLAKTTEKRNENIQ